MTETAKNMICVSVNHPNIKNPAFQPDYLKKKHNIFSQKSASFWRTEPLLVHSQCDKNLVWQMVAVLDESVSEWILSDPSWGLSLLLLSQQEVNHLLQQSLRGHLPDDPVQQGRGGQDAHLRPLCTPKKHCVTEQPRHKRQNKDFTERRSDSTCLTSASAVAPWQTQRIFLALLLPWLLLLTERQWRKNKDVTFTYKKNLDFIVIILSQHGTGTHRESARLMDLLSLLDELVTVI